MASVVPQVSGEQAAALAEELSPMPQAWDLCRQLAALPHLLFLESARPHPLLGRYSFLTADPLERIWSRGQAVFVNGQRQRETDPFAVLADRLSGLPLETRGDLPPFQGGAAGLFGYDLCHHLERLPRPRFDDFAVPDLAVGIYDWVIAFDHVSGRAWLMATGYPETAPRRRRQRARRRLEQIKQHLRNAGSASPPRQEARAGLAARDLLAP